MSLTAASVVYDPQYLDLIETTLRHEKVHWLEHDTSLNADVEQWKQGKITDQEKSLISNILRLFTNSDVSVGAGYYDKLIPHIRNTEARSMLGSFAAREATHQRAYALLTDTLGFGQEFYWEFLAYHEMSEKFEFMNDSIDSTPVGFATYLAKQTLIEGVNLFASFAVLLNFDRLGKLPGMCDIVRWSMVDECYSNDTEILTQDGWKLFSDLAAPDTVAQYDQQTKAVSFVEPSRIVSYQHNEDMVHLHSERHFDQLVTKNHDVIWAYGNDKTPRKSKSVDFKPHHRHWIPVAGYSVGTNELGPWDRLRIAFQADGSMPQGEYRNGSLCGYRRCNFSLTKERKKDRLGELCKDAKADFSISPGRGGKDVYYVDFPLDELPDKDFAWVHLNEASSIYAEEFLDEVSHWDGSKAGDHDWFVYSNTNEAAIDTVQALASLCGRRTYKKRIIDDRKDSHRDCFRLSITVQDMQRSGSVKVETIPYSGQVYCVSVPSGAVLVRRNGKVAVSGNSIHIEGNTQLFRIYLGENPEIVNDDFKRGIYDTARELVRLEDAFIDRTFDLGGVQNLRAEEVKQYVRFVTDYRLLQMGLKPNWDIPVNPLDWIDSMMGKTHSNFFERSVVEYSKDNLKGSFDGAYPLYAKP